MESRSLKSYKQLNNTKFQIFNEIMGIHFKLEISVGPARGADRGFRAAGLRDEKVEIRQIFYYIVYEKFEI